MKPLLLVLLLLLCSARAETHSVILDGARATQKWTLKELNPDIPSDWSGYEYLVLEFRSESPQRFQLRLKTASGDRNCQINPFQGAWTRAAIPLKIFLQQSREGMDMASVGNRSRPSYFLGLSGPYGPLTNVEVLEISMQVPLGKPTFEIRSVKLVKESPGDAVLESKPLVDEFGQWIQDKPKTEMEIKQAWAEENKKLDSGPYVHCQYGGFSGTKAKATGFFRVEQVDGKWWFIDPDGHLFFSTGADCMRAEMGTRTEGRDGIFKELPGTGLLPPPRRAGSPMVSFYTWNLIRRFGSDWTNKWPELTVRRMEAWGLNTVANWADPIMLDTHKKAYVVQLSGLGMDRGWLGLPDVFSSEWASLVDTSITKQCASRKEDPWLLGYFMANEPPWPGNELLIVDMIAKAPETATQRELNTWLAVGDTPERRKAFVYRAFEKYVEVISIAMRKHDPNHLNLGMRFGGGTPPPEMVKIARSFDVYSLNIYDYAPNTNTLAKIYQATGLPMLIGEFHIGTSGRGMSPGLRQARNESERGVAYQYYMETAAACPALIGAHWFQWVDEPVTGRGDGENYNIGMVDVTDIPYEGLMEGMLSTHKRIYDIHTGKETPTTHKAEAQ